jgi:excisionase family DNA binding protein
VKILGFLLGRYRADENVSFRLPLISAAAQGEKPPAMESRGLDGAPPSRLLSSGLSLCGERSTRLAAVALVALDRPPTRELSPFATQPNMQSQPPTHSRYRLAPDLADKVRTSPPLNMTVFEAAAYLCVSPRKVRELVICRRLRSARVGSKHIFRRQWLDAFLGD